jgi:hypothetical protein
MSDDELGALVEIAVKLTPEERRQLLRQAQSLLRDRARSGPSLDPSAAAVPGDVHPREPGHVGLAPCPRCGLVPAAGDTYCSRCGNRVAF